MSDRIADAEKAIAYANDGIGHRGAQAMATVAVAKATLAVAEELRRYNEVALAPTTYHTNV